MSTSGSLWMSDVSDAGCREDTADPLQQEVGLLEFLAGRFLAPP